MGPPDWVSLIRINLRLYGRFTPIVTFEALSPAGQLILMLVMFFWFVITLVMIAFTKLLKQPVYYYP
jgi:hypothetical protein